MNVIRFAVYFYQLGLEVVTDLLEDLPHRRKVGLLENIAAVFSHKDQMNMKIKNAMSACSDFG